MTEPGKVINAIQRAAEVGLTFGDAALEASVRTGLDRVETLLRESLRSEYPFVTEMSRHLAEAGGKRFRPLLALAAAHFGDPDVPEVTAAAVVVELTHLGTLYHDDVIDQAVVRRGSVSANARWDNTVAILTGDFLFSRASQLLADLGPEAVRVQAATFERLCTGEILEAVGPGPDADPVRHYLHVLSEKTGSLIATSALFGARFSGADPAVVRAVERYGELIGIAFQLSDDLIDVVAETTQSGKTPGTDLREGVRTLPILYALQSSDPAEERLRALLTGPVLDDAAHAETLRLLRASAAVEQARETLSSYAQQARDCISGLPDVPAREALDSLATFVVARTG